MMLSFSSARGLIPAISLLVRYSYLRVSAMNEDSFPYTPHFPDSRLL